VEAARKLVEGQERAGFIAERVDMWRGWFHSADPSALPYLRPPQREFHLEEYKQMRGELAAMNARLENLMRLALLAAGGVFSWLLTQGFGQAEEQGFCLRLPFQLLLFGWYLPFAFTCAAAVTAVATYWRGWQIAAYIRLHLESRLAATGSGWETVLKPKFPSMFIFGCVFWVGLATATYIAAETASKASAKERYELDDTGKVTTKERACRKG
jgi:hypothetical protein